VAEVGFAGALGIRCFEMFIVESGGCIVPTLDELAIALAHAQADP
jgi:hypothetical protein